MNTTSSSLVWATPVSYKSLIANLSAYKSEKTNLDAFIYCNNTNPENTHLPQEIVDAITARVLAPGFKENFDLWTKLETCAEKRCGRDDHVSPQQRVKMAWKRMYTFYSDNGMTPPPKRKLARQIDAEIEIMAYLVLKPRPGNKETHTVPSKVGDKRRFDDDDTSESRKAKHTKIEDTAVSEGNRKQEDIPESQEFTIPAKPSESTLSEPDSQLFGHAMRILELTPKLHDCHILIHDPTIVDEIKGWTKNERVPKLQDRLEKLR
ncbi:hypothetical protein BLS_008017, partial [Venturia inaequalis]